MNPEDEVPVFDFKPVLPSWEAWLAAWDRDVWPMFQRHHIPRGVALLCWQFNEVGNRLESAQQQGPDDPTDDWKKSA